MTSVGDPSPFDADADPDPDPNPSFHSDVDPYPVSHQIYATCDQCLQTLYSFILITYASTESVYGPHGCIFSLHSS